MKKAKPIRRSSANGKASVNSKARPLAEQSKKILDLLLDHVSRPSPTIPYANVAKAIGLHVCNLKHPMDHLSRTLELYAAREGMRIPPLQLLIVNGKTGAPGPGASTFITPPYVKKGEQYIDVSPARQKEIAKGIWEAISTFSDWEKVRKEVAELLDRDAL